MSLPCLVPCHFSRSVGQSSRAGRTVGCRCLSNSIQGALQLFRHKLFRTVEAGRVVMQTSLCQSGWTAAAPRQFGLEGASGSWRAPGVVRRCPERRTATTSRKRGSGARRATRAVTVTAAVAGAGAYYDKTWSNPLGLVLKPVGRAWLATSRHRMPFHSREASAFDSLMTWRGIICPGHAPGRGAVGGGAAVHVERHRRGRQDGGSAAVGRLAVGALAGRTGRRPALRAGRATIPPHPLQN